jgi:hypothetical protein
VSIASVGEIFGIVWANVEGMWSEDACQLHYPNRGIHKGVSEDQNWTTPAEHLL